MSFITLGNLNRFLDKLKSYISGNYLKKSGDTATNLDVNGKFRVINLSSGVPSVGYVVDDVQIGQIGMMYFYGRCNLLFTDNIDGGTYEILHTGNYSTHVPSLTGAGASGNWNINITGNASKDSDGNTIVDTYAKKASPTFTGTVTAPNVTISTSLTIPGGKIWIA